MTHKSHLLLVLMKIKNISQLFNHPIKSITTINYWPSRDALHQHLQSAFKSYKNCMYYWLRKSIYPKATKLFGSCYYLVQIQLHKFNQTLDWNKSCWCCYFFISWLGWSNIQQTVDNWVRLAELVDLWKLNFSRQGIHYCRRGGNKGACPCNNMLSWKEITNDS